MKTILFFILFLIPFLSSSHEEETQNWTSNLDTCQITVDEVKVTLPLIPPCFQAKNGEGGSPNIEEYEGRTISIIIGTTDNFDGIKKHWDYVTEEDYCSEDSVAINLDKNGRPIEISQPIKGGGLLCQNFIIDIKWFWSYEWLEYTKI